MKEPFHNCLSVEKTSAGWLPHRFTPSQTAYYASLSEFAAIRAHCSSGVTLDFVSDAPEISFSFSSEGFCRGWLAFDLFENGRFMHSAIYHEPVPSGQVVFRRGHGGQADFTIHLPYSCQVTLRDFHAGNFSPKAPAREGLLWCIGDSITQGMEALHPSQTFAALLGEILQMNVLNLGVGASGFKDLCLDFAGLPKPDAVLVAHGTNDGPFALEDWEGYRQRTAACTARIQQAAAGAPVTLLSPLWRGDLERQGLADIMPRIRSLLEERAGQMGWRFIDGLTVLPQEPAFCGDGYLHPNDLGFSICARVLSGLLAR